MQDDQMGNFIICQNSSLGWAGQGVTRRGQPSNTTGNFLSGGGDTGLWTVRQESQCEF